MMTKKEAGKVIHNFAMAHGGTALLLGPVPFADTAALTAETIAMVAYITKKCGASWEKATIEAFAAQQLARYIGVTAANEIATLLPPPLSSIFKAGTSVAITEAVGWATYHSCA